MKKSLLLALGILLIAGNLLAQNFEPAPSEIQTKLEKYLGKYGSTERIMLTDRKNKTFDANAGENYLVAFVYDVNSTTTRRMLVHELGPAGEKMNPQYPASSNGYRGINGIQMFLARLSPNAVTTYKIDSNQEATIYIYKLKPGVK